MQDPNKFVQATFSLFGAPRDRSKDYKSMNSSLTNRKD